MIMFSFLYLGTIAPTVSLTPSFFLMIFFVHSGQNCAGLQSSPSNPLKALEKFGV